MPIWHKMVEIGKTVSEMKEFVEKLLRELEEYYKENEYEINCGFIEVCKDIATRHAEEYGNGWIPCSERLPEEEINVIITTKAGNVMVGLYTKRYGSEMKEGFICSNCFIYLKTVLAWMSLPGSYRLEE